jgi:hypothetical protein
MPLTSIRKAIFIIEMILLNIVLCLIWWWSILVRPEGVKALLVLLPFQIGLNYGIVLLWRRYRSQFSGLTVIFVAGLLYGLFQALYERNWWMLCFVPISIGLIWWSIKAHRLSQVR